MRVLIDTNVLIDFVCDREGFADNANAIFALGYLGEVKLLTSALSFVTTMYVAHKHNYQKVQRSLTKIAEFVEVQDLSANTTIEMLSTDWSDYEDATQHRTAVQALANCIVTRNKNDFQKSSIPVYEPSEFLHIISPHI